MTVSWRRDKSWSDTFIPEIKRIIGEHLIGEPPIEEDQHRNTDLLVLKLDAIRIACRIRKNEYLLKYPFDVTIRCDRPSGNKTELEKIIEGWGDYFFYGFSSSDCTCLAAWRLIDLNLVRRWLFDHRDEMKLKTNGDNSSSFVFIDTRHLDRKATIAKCRAAS